MDYQRSAGGVLLPIANLTNLLLRATAWRAILKAAVPGHRVRWRSVTGAYLAGAGLNGVLPARGGDGAKVVLVNRSIPGASCAVVTSGLLVETLLVRFALLDRSVAPELPSNWMR